MAADGTLLLHLSDPHLFADRAAMMRGVSTARTLGRVLDHAREHHWPPAAILLTGDLAQDESRGGYEHLRALMAPLGVPVHCLPGNHDDPALVHGILDQDPFTFCASLDIGGWHVFMLSTHKSGSASGLVSAAELARLDAELAANAGKPALVGLHHHPVPMASAWLDTVALRNAPEFFAVLDRHPQVRAVIWGHVHQVFRGTRRGVSLLSTPSTCVQFLPRSRQFRLDARGPAYRWLRLQKNGTLRSKAVWLDALATDSMKP